MSRKSQDPTAALGAWLARHHDGGNHPSCGALDRCYAERAEATIAGLWEALRNTSLAYDTGFQDGLGEAGQIHAETEEAYVNEIARLRTGIRLAQVEASEVAWSLGRDHPMFDRLMMAVTRLAALAGGSE